MDGLLALSQPGMLPIDVVQDSIIEKLMKGFQLRQIEFFWRQIRFQLFIITI